MAFMVPPRGTRRTAAGPTGPAATSPDVKLADGGRTIGSSADRVKSECSAPRTGSSRAAVSGPGGRRGRGTAGPTRTTGPPGHRRGGRRGPHRSQCSWSAGTWSSRASRPTPITRYRPAAVDHRAASEAQQEQGEQRHRLAGEASPAVTAPPTGPRTDQSQVQHHQHGAEQNHRPGTAPLRGGQPPPNGRDEHRGDQQEPRLIDEQAARRAREHAEQALEQVRRPARGRQLARRGAEWGAVHRPVQPGPGGVGDCRRGPEDDGPARCPHHPEAERQHEQARGEPAGDHEGDAAPCKSVAGRDARRACRNSSSSTASEHRITPLCCHSPRPTVEYITDPVAKSTVITQAGAGPTRWSASRKNNPRQPPATQQAVHFCKRSRTTGWSGWRPKARASVTTGRAKGTMPEG